MSDPIKPEVVVEDVKAPAVEAPSVVSPIVKDAAEDAAPAVFEVAVQDEPKAAPVVDLPPPAAVAPVPSADAVVLAKCGVGSEFKKTDQGWSVKIVDGGTVVRGEGDDIASAAASARP